MYHRGSAKENAGEDYLLSRADEFVWFGHMWKHTQAHKMNASQLVQEMNKNLIFAQDHDIPILHPYSVAPHHSGVFPGMGEGGLRWTGEKNEKICCW